jgi:uncharacterized protein YbaP (TraB family)
MTRPIPCRSGSAAILACFLVLLAVPAAADLNCPELKLATGSGEPPPRHARGLLWRVAKPGVAANHVFGTIHLGDPEIVNLAPAVTGAFDRSRAMVMEVKLEDIDPQQWSRSMTFTGGGSLEQQLGRELFGRTASLLDRYGVAREAAAVMKPWAAYMTLMMPPSAKGIPLDLVLAIRAAEAGKAVAGLESADEQVSALSSLPADDQVGLVNDLVCHYDAMQADVKDMKQLYLARDLAGLFAVSSRYELNEMPRYQRLMQQLLWDRNERMVQRMGQYLAKGGTFVAIGALHLPGERGVLGLLEKAGYSVDMVY